MSSTDEIVLGEGVAIDAGAASVVMRAGSGAIDAAIYFTALSLSWKLIGDLGFAINQAIGMSIAVATVVTFLVLIPATVETLTRGLSVGRLAVGLRIVRDDGGPISVRYAFGRALMGVLEIYFSFGLLAVVTSFMSAKGKRIGDMLVGTYAMRTRGGRKSLAAIPMPFGMAEWAQKADITRLPDGLALTARLFLTRVKEMNPQTRYRLGVEIAQQIEPFVAPAPPPGTHPESFIAAVLASRRDREYAALIRAQERSTKEYSRLDRLPYGIADLEH